MTVPAYDKNSVIDFPTYGYPPLPFDVEDLDRYCPGGLHPILLGDVLGDRYEVMRKLGHGGYATVWLCYDLTENTWRAVKVVSACASDERSSSELKMLKHVEDISDEELERHHICLSRDNFFVDGPNGRHLCIVMPIFGRTLHDEMQWYDKEFDDDRYACLQLAKAMAFLHSKGVCHGDFRPRNVLYALQGLDDLSVDQMMEMLGETIERIVVPPPPTGNGAGPGPHLPEYIYPCFVLEPPTEMCTRRIVVTDFGEAYHISDAPRTTGIPLSHASPEVMLPNEPLGYGADIWALASIVCELRMGRTLLPEYGTYDYVQMLEVMLGPLPEPHRSGFIAEFKKGWKQAGPSPGSDVPLGDPVTLKTESLERYRQETHDEGYETKLEKLIREDHGYGTGMEPGEVLGPNERDDGGGCKWVTRIIPTQEADQLVDLLTKMFTYDPAKRLPAAEVLTHPWFQEITATPDGDDIVMGADVVLEEDGLAPKQEGILGWFARVARSIFPRLYGGPMLLGGLCIHGHLT